MFPSAASLRVLLPQILLRSSRVVAHRNATFNCCSQQLARTYCISKNADSTEEHVASLPDSTEEHVASLPDSSPNLDLIQVVKSGLAETDTLDGPGPPSTGDASSAALKGLSIDQIKGHIIQTFDPLNAVETLSQLSQSSDRRVGRILDSVTADLLDGNRFQEALNLVETVVEKEVLSIHGQTYSRVLNGFIELRKASDDSDIEDQFAAFIHFMIENGYETGIRQQHQVVRMASLVGNGQLAQVFFDRLKADEDYEIRGSDYGLLIQAFIKEARNKNDYSNHTTVLHYFNEALDSGVELNDHGLKMVIENSVLSGTVEDVRPMIMKLTKDMNLYLEFIDLLASEPLLTSARARKKLGKYRHNGYWEGFKKLYRATVNTIKKNIVADLNSPHSLETLSPLKQSDDRRFTIVTHAVVEYLLTKDQLDDAVDFTKMLTENELTISSQTYSMLLRRMVERKKANMESQIEEQLYTFVEFMSEKGHKMDAYQHAQVLRMAVLAGNDKLAQVCFDELEANMDYQPNSADYGRMLRILTMTARNQKDYSNQETLLRYFKDMVDKGLDQKPINIKAFIENSVLGGTVDESRIEIMKLTKDTDYYLEYLDLLVEIELLLKSQDVRGARKVWKKTKYNVDCEMFMRLYFK